MRFESFLSCFAGFRLDSMPKKGCLAMCEEAPAPGRHLDFGRSCCSSIA